MKDLTVIIVNYKTPKLLSDCLDSLFKYKPSLNFEVVVVDNNSQDESVDMIRRRFKQVKLIESKSNLGFAGGNNLALKQYYRQSKYCLLLNSDTRVSSQALDKLFQTADENNWGISSCRLVFPDGRFQPNGGKLPYLWPIFLWGTGLDNLINKITNVMSYQAINQNNFVIHPPGWVGGTAMLVRSDVFKKIGFLDDKIFMYGEDVDFCFRAQQAGIRVGWTNSAQIIHVGGGSLDTPKYSQWLGEFRGLIYFYRKHFGIIRRLGLRFLLRVFILMRVVAFAVVGKENYAKSYAKIFFNL